MVAVVACDNAPGALHNGPMGKMPVVPEADIAVPNHILAAVSDASRPEADRALDVHRKPDKLFAFLGLEPGFRIGELMCASGYSVGVMSPIVGGDGVVYGQNSPLYLERFGDRLSDRICASRLSNVEQIIADMEQPGFHRYSEQLSAVPMF